MAKPSLARFCVCAIVAIAARFVSEHYGAPVMLMALLLGMALNFLSIDGACKTGIDLTAKEVLRIGVALLGLRITLEQVTALGWQPVLVVVAAITFTIVLGIVLAWWMDYRIFSDSSPAVRWAFAVLRLRSPCLRPCAITRSRKKPRCSP